MRWHKSEAVWIQLAGAAIIGAASTRVPHGVWERLISGLCGVFAGFAFMNAVEEERDGG